MSDVFISYSRRDKVFTQKLYEALTTASRDVWADWDDIPASSDWDAEIKQGIQETNSVLFVLSPEWIKSNECRKEMIHAVSMGKRLFPILYLPVDPKDVPPELAKINWVYLRDADDFDKGFQTLCSAMDTDLEWIKTHTRIQVRALEWDKKNRSASFALRGEDLTEGERFLANGATKNPIPTQLQSDYILASRTDATRRQRQTLAGVTLALVISIALGITAFIQRHEAVKQAAISRNGELSAQSIALRETNFQVSLLLGIEAHNDGLGTVQSQTALLDNAQAHPQLITYLDGPHAELSFAFSPDGKTLVSASADSDITLWNVSTYKQIGIFESDIRGAYSIALSPDGKILASCSGDIAIVLWDVEKRKQIGQLSDRCRNAAFSLDGKLLATNNGGNIINLWDFASLKPIGQLNGSSSFVFSPKSSVIAFSDTDGKITLWDVTRQQRVRQFEGISPIAFSPDGKTLALGGGDNNIILWDIETGNVIGQTLTEYTESVTSVAFSPDGNTIASGSADHNIILWNTKTGKPISQPLKGHTESVTNITFSPDGRTLASASCGKRSELFFCSRGEIILWNVTPDKLISQRLAEHNGVTSIAFSPDGQTLAAGYDDNKIILWDITTGKPIDSPLAEHKDLVSSVAFSPDGKILASGGSDGNIILWDVKKHQSIAPPLEQNAEVTSVAFSVDGQMLASSSKDGSILLWDVKSRNSVGQLRKEDTEIIWSVAFSPDGKTLASGGAGSFQLQDTIILWDVNTRKPIGQMPVETIVPASSVAFSIDGKILASGSFDGNISLWDVRKKEIIRHLTGFTSEIYSVAFSPAGETLAAGGVDSTIILWDIATGKPIGQPLIGHLKSISEIAYSRDGKALASGGLDGNIFLWDAEVESWVKNSCRRAGRNFTADEWSQYFPNEKYRETCLQLDLNRTQPSTQQ